MISLIGTLVLHIFVVKVLGLVPSNYNLSDENVQYVPSCGGIFKTPIFQLTSPEWPAEYPGGIQCEYVVEPYSPDVCILEVKFLDFQLPPGDGNCNLDSLTIAGKVFCGEMIGSEIIPFQQPKSVVQFQSLYGGGRGFNILVHQHECTANQHLLDTCGGIFYGYNLELLSPGFPNFYPNNINCTYTLKRVDDGICQFMVTFFNSALEESKGCIKDKLVIEEDILCGNLVGSRRYSMNTDLNIRFITDSNESNKGFRIKVEQIPCTYITSETIAKQDEVTPYPLHKIPYPQFLEPQINPSIAPQAPSQYLCCGRVYNDKHFLLISPGFPKSQPSDCLYTITKYNPSTYQLRLQFIFFWIDEQNNNNQYCGNEFLEIDGKRYCGCKTGLILTSAFQEDWEIEKVIRLKTNYISNRPFSGFIVEVFQDEYTLPRQKRSNEKQDTFIERHYTNHTNENLKQNSNSVLLKTPFVESISNRNFQTTTTQDLPYVWDPIQKFWTLSQNFLCLRWGVSDWVVLVRELLWSQYQCPGTTSNNEVSSTPYPMYLPQYGYGYTNVYRKCCY